MRSADPGHMTRGHVSLQPLYTVLGVIAGIAITMIFWSSGLYASLTIPRYTDIPTCTTIVLLNT